MKDDIVKTLLESLTPDQKDQLVKGLLNSNVKGDVPTPSQSSGDEEQDSEEAVSSNPHSVVNEDFSVTRENVEGSKTVVKFTRNKWVDKGEHREEPVDYEKFEKTKTPRRRGKPSKKKVECHVCGKTFSINESLIYGEYIRCNRCTGR